MLLVHSPLFLLLCAIYKNIPKFEEANSILYGSTLNSIFAVLYTYSCLIETLLDYKKYIMLH